MSIEHIAYTKKDVYRGLLAWVEIHAVCSVDTIRTICEVISITSSGRVEIILAGGDRTCYFVQPDRLYKRVGR